MLNMKTLIALSLLLIALFQSAENVVVKEGEFSFSLEEVRKLKDFLDHEKGVKPNNRMGLAHAAAMCKSPSLPEMFRPLCQNKDAEVSLVRLGMVTRHMDACEICAFVACTDC